MKTSELTGAALDWAVAKCEGVECDELHCLSKSITSILSIWFNEDGLTAPRVRYSPSTDWTQGGPVVEREKITLEWTGEDWMAYIRHDEEFFAATPLIAAMHCYVASQLGDEVDVPAELIG